MTENIFLAASFFPAAAAVLIFFMKYLSEVLQSRVRLGQDEAYRALATSVAGRQDEMARMLAEIGGRLQGIEKILKDVG